MNHLNPQFYHHRTQVSIYTCRAKFLVQNHENKLEIYLGYELI